MIFLHRGGIFQSWFCNAFEVRLRQEGTAVGTTHPRASRPLSVSGTATAGARSVARRTPTLQTAARSRSKHEQPTEQPRSAPACMTIGMDRARSQRPTLGEWEQGRAQPPARPQAPGWGTPTLHPRSPGQPHVPPAPAPPPAPRAAAMVLAGAGLQPRPTKPAAGPPGLARGRGDGGRGGTGTAGQGWGRGRGRGARRGRAGWEAQQQEQQ